MVTVSLSDATREVARRDRVLTKAIARLGPIEHIPRDPDGPFGALARAIVYQQLGGPGRASDLHARRSGGWPGADPGDPRRSLR